MLEPMSLMIARFSFRQTDPASVKRMIDPDWPTATSLAAICAFLIDHTRVGGGRAFRALEGFVVETPAVDSTFLVTSIVKTSPKLDIAQMVLPPLMTLQT